MTPVIGVVVCFAGSYVPRFWASCDGQTLLISQNPALFKLLGTTYGGNGVTTFHLPDLRGRTAVSAGPSSLRRLKLGESAGSASVTLGLHQIPAHEHSAIIDVHFAVTNNPAIENTVNDGYPAARDNAYAASGANGPMYPPEYSVTIGDAGSGVPVDTRSPFLVITHIICLEGIFPPRP